MVDSTLAGSFKLMTNAAVTGIPPICSKQSAESRWI